jgi:arsenate reductase
MWAVAVIAGFVVADDQRNPAPLYPSLHRYVEARAAEFDLISSDRKKRLEEVARFVRGRVANGQSAELTFICTHNSRRSHLAQIWAKTAAEYYGVAGVETFSGGTEATAFNPRAVNALKRAGLNISAAETGPQNNPRYRAWFSDSAPPLECFSKVYGDAPNPKNDFCAVMVCSQADAACPVVVGAQLRISLPYDDPKAFDGTPEEAQKYDERCQQIAREMLYLFSKVKP